jgi:hypothetical protein
LLGSRLPPIGTALLEAAWPAHKANSGTFREVDGKSIAYTEFTTQGMRS